MNPALPIEGPPKGAEKKSILHWVTSNVLASSLIVVLSLSLVFMSIYLPKHTKGRQAERLAQLEAQFQKLQSSFDEAKTKNTNLEADRNNILAQTKFLLAEKSKVQETQDTYNQLKKANAVLLSLKDNLHRESQSLNLRYDAAKNDLASLKIFNDDLAQQNKLIEKENEELRKAITRKVESAPPYKKISADLQKQNNENKKLNEQNKSLNNELKKSKDRLAKINARDIQFAKQLRTHSQSINALKLENKNLQKTNEKLNRALAEGPKRFKQMTQENQTMIKETSDMHYNMGVFFIKNKNYDMAFKEFRRALDYNPNNAKVHYNLGYLYAEELSKPDEAMAHFKRYLEIDPNSKESEPLRTYILVNQTFAGDQPAKR